MARIFYPSSEKLWFLLESIHHREVALPDFQRDFVWDPRATKELIESILQNYPAGSLLRIKNRSGFFFAMDSFSSRSPEPSLRSSAKSVQTRLTAYSSQGSGRRFRALRGGIDPPGETRLGCQLTPRQRR